MPWRIQAVLFYPLFCIFIPFSMASLSKAAYFTKVDFSKLDGNSIETTATRDALLCCWRCLRLSGCLSLNFAVLSSENGLFECVLLRHKVNGSVELLQPTLLYHHYIREEDKCAVPRCLNGGTCEPLVSDFSCSCPQGWMGKTCEKRDSMWLKINSRPVCFGAINSGFGRFYVQQNGTVTIIKLKHISGSVTCYGQAKMSNWGCKDSNVVNDKLFTIITDSDNKKILPQDEFMTSSSRLEYKLPGFTSMSSELVFSPLSPPMAVTAGQEFRIWFGEDLKDSGEDGNAGRACTDVHMYGLFV